MPPRRNYRFDDNGPVYRRKKKGKTGLIVGLCIAGVILLALIITAVVLTTRRSARPITDDPGTVLNLKKPEGTRTVGDLEEVDDPNVVDRTWPKLTGKWVRIDGKPGDTVYEFLSDYRYREEWTDFRGEFRSEINPVQQIRDDSGTINAKTKECVTIFYEQRNADGSGRLGGDIINFYPDGTLDISGQRYRRAK